MFLPFAGLGQITEEEGMKLYLVFLNVLNISLLMHTTKNDYFPYSTINCTLENKNERCLTIN